MKFLMIVTINKHTYILSGGEGKAELGGTRAYPEPGEWKDKAGDFSAQSQRLGTEYSDSASRVQQCWGIFSNRGKIYIVTIDLVWWIYFIGVQG